MLVGLIGIAAFQDPPERTPSIYRCPASEGEDHWFPGMISESEFDRYCVEPKPGPKARAAARGQVKFVSAASIDTAANVRWRDAAVAFALGKISPKEWLRRTHGLGETVHFLSNPRRPNLREAMGRETGPSVLAEMLVVSWPGMPCFTADDIVQTRYFPEDKRHESWVLAMNDYLGPMLSYRHSVPEMVTGKPQILRADPTPGLLVFRQRHGKRSLTFILNNGKAPMELPGDLDMDRMTMNVRINADGPKPRLNPFGFVIIDSGEPEG